MTWEMSSFMARATEPRRFDVPLRDVIRRRKVRVIMQLVQAALSAAIDLSGRDHDARCNTSVRAAASLSWVLPVFYLNCGH